MPTIVAASPFSIWSLRLFFRAENAVAAVQCLAVESDGLMFPDSAGVESGLLRQFIEPADLEIGGGENGVVLRRGGPAAGGPLFDQFFVRFHGRTGDVELAIGGVCLDDLFRLAAIEFFDLLAFRFRFLPANGFQLKTAATVEDGTERPALFDGGELVVIAEQDGNGTCFFSSP